MEANDKKTSANDKKPSINDKKPSANNRKMAWRKRKAAKKANQKTSENTNQNAYANDECLSKKICKGKHKKMEPNETFVKNAEKLFKNHVVKVVNTQDECLAAITELRT